jgi:hypothetical protein
MYRLAAEFEQYAELRIRSAKLAMVEYSEFLLKIDKESLASCT